MRHWIRLATTSIVKAFGSARILWLVVGLALACALFLGSQKLQPSDDAYITFRHVRNFLEHGRPAWNLSGDPVLGTTTPAFVLALAVFCKALGIDRIDQAALCLNSLLHFLVVILTYLVAKDHVRRVFPSVLVALLVGFNSPSLHVFSQGFENPMLVVTLLASLYFVRVRCDAFSLVLTSIAPLIRPEGIILMPLVWGQVLLQRRFKKRLLLAFLLVPLVWLAFSIPYYGSPIPHAILV